MIKALYIRTTFDPGGTETLLLDLYNYPQDSILFYYAILNESHLIEKLQNRSNRYFLFRRKHKIDFTIIARLNKILRNEDIKIVHSHQLIELIYAIILKIKNPGILIFHTIHGYFPKLSFFNFIEIGLILFTKRSFTVSNGSKNKLRSKGYPGFKIDVLYNAVPVPLINTQQILEIKQVLNIKTGDLVIGMIGNFVWWKDQFTIIRAFNSLRDAYPGLKVVFIGKETNLTNKCRSELYPGDLNKRVFFLGSLPQAKELLPLFDLFVFSTIADTFGIVAVEAILQDVPLITSDIAPMVEISDNGYYFPLFKTRDYLDLAEKITCFLKGFLVKNHKSTKEVFMEKFSMANHLKRLITYYEG